MAMCAVTLTLLGFFFYFSTLTDATTEEPKVELLTQTSDAMVGSRVLLLCRANKATTFRWEKDGEEIDEGIENEDEKSKLTLENVQLSDSGNYTCHGDFVNSEHEQIISIYVYETPSFGKTQTYHEFLVNSTVHVPCLVTGKPEVEINWFWNGYRVVNNDTSNLNVLPDGTLQITSIQRENHGTYVCQGKIKGRPKSETLNISVVVNVPPTVIVRGPQNKIVAGLQQSVSLSCLVTGAPHPNITWKTPDTSDSSRYIYNSDKSQLTIQGVTRGDSGKYICTASNKLGDDSATFSLDVLEIPLVSLSKSGMVVKPGDSASVLCSASGHPKPTIQWLNKSNNKPMQSAGRVRAIASQFQIDNVGPSDGGVYSCKATNEAGSKAENFMLITSPAEPTSFTLSPGPSAFSIKLQTPVLDGGSPITHYTVQWKNKSQDVWNEIAIPYSGSLEVRNLEPYTEFSVRFAAKNKHFLGSFTAEEKIRTLARQGEPDVPVLSADKGKIEKNSYSVPFEQLNDGGSPITNYVVRYRMMKEGETWREKETEANSTNIHIQNLEYDTSYEAEIFAVNSNGLSKPERVYFTTPQAPPSLGKGGVVAIVLVIFVVMLLGVDALCCYTNHCGMINFLAQKLFGPNVSESKSLEEGVFNNIAVTMNGLDKPRGSIPKLQSQNKTGNGVQQDVTCDKAPLTKFEKEPAKAECINEARL